MLINSIQLSKNRATAAVNTAVLICKDFDKGQWKKPCKEKHLCMFNQKCPQCHFYATTMIKMCQMWNSDTVTSQCPSHTTDRKYSLILHGSGLAVVSVFTSSSLQAVSGVKHMLLAPWKITFLALSLGWLLGKYIWTALQSIIEGRPTQVPVQPPSPEESAWMGRLRSIHPLCKFSISFFLDMNLEEFTSWHPKTSRRPNNQTAESFCCGYLISLWPCPGLPLNCGGLCASHSHWSTYLNHFLLKIK